MTFLEIKEQLQHQFGHDVIQAVETNLQPYIIIPVDLLHNCCTFLYRDENMYFDFLSCITGVDNGPDIGTMEVIYQLYSIPYHHGLMLKVIVQRNQSNEPLPEVPTISSLWATANWLEREVYDLFGIVFKEHPDLRRILLPADWQGYPLRKDYQQAEEYHGITVSF